MPRNRIRVLIEVDNSQPFQALRLTPAGEAIAVPSVDDLLETFLDPDEDAFKSGILARELLTQFGARRFMDWIAETAANDPIEPVGPELSHMPHGYYINIMDRPTGTGTAIPTEVIKNVTATKWTGTG